MLKRTVAGLVVLGMLAAPAWAFRRLELGQAVEGLRFETLDRREFGLEEVAGAKATVIAFWASWSPRSARVLADLGDWYGRWGDRGLGALAVNVDHETWGKDEVNALARYMAEHDVRVPAAVDWNLDLYDRFGVTVVPSLVLLDANGVVSHALGGYSDMGREEFWAAVARALGLDPDCPGRGDCL
ncbi:MULTISPECIES: TlpA family protein disulfide reductase [Deferrisoma]